MNPTAFTLLVLLVPGIQAEAEDAFATRIRPGAVRIDGTLDEPVWRTAPSVCRFVQGEPHEASPATDATDLVFLYDTDALYVGARMSSAPATPIQAPVSRRDDADQAEQLIIYLDAYLDRRTADVFGVTASGIRLDHHLTDDSATTADKSFDPVWEARTHVDGRGWTAEMRIPFSQLHFNHRPEHVWGLNVERWVPTRNERVYWVMVPKEESGWVSRFGLLRGIRGIDPPNRTEILPYATSLVRLAPNAHLGNPLRPDRQFEGRLGGDLKRRLGSNLVLQAAVNPDFGQVEADPAEVNLTAFETIFPEKRPFFTESQQLLQGRQSAYFYSRRVGAVPPLAFSADYVDPPRASSILGAAKVTGRLANGTSVGVLTAVTGAESARLLDEGEGDVRRARAAPATTFGVMRLQRELGGRSSATAIFTTVHRHFTRDDPLSLVLARDAFTGGLEGMMRTAGGSYEFSAAGGVSLVEGQPEAMTRVQRSSAHYFQRPDARHVELDTNRRSLFGYTTAVAAEKRTGRWLWSASLKAQSPGFELNDIGRLRTADAIDAVAWVRYRNTRPGPRFHAYSIELRTDDEWNFVGVPQFRSLRSNATCVLKNFWTADLTAFLDFRATDQWLTRGGPLMGLGVRTFGRIGVSNAASSPDRWTISARYDWTEEGERRNELQASYSLQPRPRWKLSVAPRLLWQTDPRQYVATIDGGRPETFGRRYVFSTIDRRTVSVQLRAAYAFTPDLTLEAYAEPFAASGRYSQTGELLAPRSRQLLLYGTRGTAVRTGPDGVLTVTDGTTEFRVSRPDFDVGSFRSNAVLRWEWRAGSTLYLVWQDDKGFATARGEGVGIGDLWRSMTSPGTRTFAVKVTYWLPVRWPR